MSAVLRFLRARTIYALILLLLAFVIGVELVRPGTVTPLWASSRAARSAGTENRDAPGYRDATGDGQGRGVCDAAGTGENI